MTEREQFPQMSLVQKINVIDRIIEENIRDFLVKDNGDMELVNIVEQNDLLIVYVEFQGACVSCESAGNTHKSVENILQRMLADNIRVFTI